VMVYGAIQRKDIYIAITLLLLGFLFRWMYVSNLDIDNPLRGDAGSYFIYAQNLLDYGVFSRDRTGVPLPDAYWAPGYPFFLAVCLKLAALFDVNYYPVVLFLQACLGGGIVFFTYCTGRFFLSSTAAAFAAGLTILSPHLNSLGGNFLSETLFTFWLVVSIFVYLKAINSPNESYTLWWLCGGLFGLAYLTNPVALFVLPLLFIGFWFKQYKNITINPKFKSWLICLAVFFCMVLGWQIRNIANVSSEKESSSDRAFQNIVIGSHSDYHFLWKENLLAPPGSILQFNQADEDMARFSRDHAGFYRVLLERVHADPVHYLQWYLLQKPAELWGWNILFGQGDIYQYPVNSTIYHK
jgi:4-amino-4-deoxy-L-arabinose transferase-like glycosyltransferase